MDGWAVSNRWKVNAVGSRPCSKSVYEFCVKQSLEKFRSNSYSMNQNKIVLSSSWATWRTLTTKVD